MDNGCFLHRLHAENTQATRGLAPHLACCSQGTLLCDLQMGIINRDIKLENTLLDNSRRPLLKICDFGYSKHQKDSLPKSKVGTPGYTGAISRCPQTPLAILLLQDAGPSPSISTPGADLLCLQLRRSS